MKPKDARVLSFASFLTQLTLIHITPECCLLVPFHESKASLRVAMRGFFFRLFRPARSKPICRLDGCSRPRFEEPATGRIHDFCGRSHARAFEEQAWSGPNRQAGLGASQGRQAAPASAGRFDENEEYWTQEMVLFWQPPSMFSQWTPSPFVVDHVSYSCAEQFMMAGKARLFGDHDALAQIMATDSPSAHKKLGRGVRGYNSDTWDRQKRDIVMRGSYEKFKQNPHMARHLLDTREKTLAEASPYDPVWGIGLRADDPAAWTKNTWRGQNLLGGILQEVRSRLLMEEAGLSSL